MKKILLISFILTFCNASHAGDYKLHPGSPDFEGQRFDIDLKYNCPEGEMTCDDVDYDGINKKTGARLRLKGGVLYNHENYDFQGYIFKNGSYTYVLIPDYSQESESGQIWRLGISFKNKEIAEGVGLMR